MKPQSLALAFLLVTAAPAAAISVKDFYAQTPHQQAATLDGLIKKMTADISKKNPDLAENIRDYFFGEFLGHPVSDGMERLTIELAVLETKSDQGKADLSKTQLEDVIARFVEQNFPVTNTPISVKEFDALPPASQTTYLRHLVQKMVNDLWDKNPQLAQHIKDYFFVTLIPDGRATEGNVKFFHELTALEDQAKQGKADLSQIQVENLILSIVKEKFPPPTAVR